MILHGCSYFNQISIRIIKTCDFLSPTMCHKIVSLLSLEISLLGKLSVLLLQLDLALLQLCLTRNQGLYQLIYRRIASGNRLLAVLVLLVSLLIVPWWTIHCSL